MQPLDARRKYESLELFNNSPNDNNNKLDIAERWKGLKPNSVKPESEYIINTHLEPRAIVHVHND